jgi:hypothetical protein
MHLINGKRTKSEKAQKALKNRPKFLLNDRTKYIDNPISAKPKSQRGKILSQG